MVILEKKKKNRTGKKKSQSKIAKFGGRQKKKNQARDISNLSKRQGE